MSKCNSRRKARLVLKSLCSEQPVGIKFHVLDTLILPLTLALHTEGSRQLERDYKIKNMWKSTNIINYTPPFSEGRTFYFKGLVMHWANDI